MDHLGFQIPFRFEKTGVRGCQQALCPLPLEALVLAGNPQPPLFIGFVFVSLGISAHFIRNRRTDAGTRASFNMCFLSLSY